MDKWLLFIGYNLLGNGKWKDKLGNYCVKEIDSNRFGVIQAKELDYKIILFTANGEVTVDLYNLLFSKLKINSEDQIIILCHENWQGHPYGSKEQELVELLKDYQNLRFSLFVGDAPDENDNYPYWLILQLGKW